MPTKRLHLRRRLRGTLIVPALLTGLVKAKQIANAMNYREKEIFPKQQVGDGFWQAVFECLSIASRKHNKAAGRVCFDARMSTVSL